MYEGVRVRENLLIKLGHRNLKCCSTFHKACLRNRGDEPNSLVFRNLKEHSFLTGFIKSPRIMFGGKITVTTFTQHFITSYETQACF